MRKKKAIFRLKGVDFGEKHVKKRSFMAREFEPQQFGMLTARTRDEFLAEQVLLVFGSDSQRLKQSGKFRRTAIFPFVHGNHYHPIF